MGAPRVWSPLQGCAPWALKRVAPLGLTPPPSKVPRVWSPLQGCAPWALKRIAPLGLTPPSKAPRVWSPLQGCAPWALKRIAPLGLTPPPGNYQGARLSGGIIHHPALHKDKRAALWVAPLGLWYCGCGRSPTAEQAPIGAIPPQSPGCAALQGRPNPGLGSPPYKEALQGRPFQTLSPNDGTNPDSRASPSGAILPKAQGVRSPERATKPWEHQPPHNPQPPHPPQPPRPPPDLRHPTHIPPSTPPTKRSAHAARVGDSAQRGRSGDFLVWARCGGLEVCRIARVVLAPILLA